MNNVGTTTFYLVARPSLCEGIARNLDFGNTLHVYNESLSEEEADSVAIQNDWIATGLDIRSAITNYAATGSNAR